MGGVGGVQGSGRREKRWRVMRMMMMMQGFARLGIGEHSHADEIRRASNEDERMKPACGAGAGASFT